MRATVLALTLLAAGAAVRAAPATGHGREPRSAHDG